MAKSVRERRDELLAANAADVEEARADGLTPAMIDRLTLTAKGVETMAPGPGAGRRAARPGRRDHRPEAPPDRHPGRQDARAAGRGRHHLRSAAQRHCRRRRAVPQVRQRRHPARRQGSDPLQPGDRRLRARGTRGRRPAGDGRAGDRDHRPRGRRPSRRHAGIRRCHRAARRQGPDRARREGCARARDQAPRRQLPRLHRRPTPTRTRPCASSRTPRPSAWAPATPPSRCWSRARSPATLLPEIAAMLHGQGRRNPRLRRDARRWCPTPSRRPKRTTTPSTWRRSSP